MSSKLVCNSSFGTQPEASDLLTMRRTRSRTGSSSLKRLDGIGSNKQVVDFEEFTNFDNMSGGISTTVSKTLESVRHHQTGGYLFKELKG